MQDLQRLKASVNAGEGFMRMLGIEVTALEPGYCECRAPLGPEKNNPHGIAHGGFLFTVCDTAAGVAGTTLGRGVVGRTADIHFLRPGTGAYVTARGRVTEAGRTMGLCQVELFDDRDQLIVTGSFELYFLGSVPQGT